MRSRVDYEKLDRIKARSTASINNESSIQKDTSANYRWLWGIILAIIISWVPFYGYSYLNARISGIGFYSVFVTMDIWGGVNFFVVSFMDFFKNDFLGWAFAKPALEVAVAIFIVMLIVTCRFWTRKKVKKFVTSTSGRFSKALKNNFFFSLISSFFIFLFVYLLPSAIAAVLAFVTFFSILGYIFGAQDGKAVLVEQSCIYGGSTDSCAQITINGAKKIGYVDYANANQTFFISNDGRYYLNSKGTVLQYVPFSIDLDIYPKKSKDFTAEKWASDVDVRASMLKSFIDEPDSKDMFSRSYVVSILGEPEVLFHYEEFPAYKLSTKSDCAVAFPYDWGTELIVNTVILGDCNGVLNL